MLFQDNNVGIKNDIIDAQKFVEWIKTRYVPAWKYNSQTLIQQLSSFDLVKSNVSDFRSINEMSIRKFEKYLDEIKQKIDAVLINPTQDNIIKIYESFTKALNLITLQVKEAISLKKACDYKNIDAREIFEQNSKLYKPFNDYFWVIYSKIIKRFQGSTNLLTFLKYGRKYFDIHFKIEIDNKTINILIFYDSNFSFSRTKIDDIKFKCSSKDLIKIECQKIINAPFESPLKKRANEILAKTDHAILEEFANGILENLIAVLKFNTHLIKATNTNLNLRISIYGARAAFLHTQSSFNWVLIGIDMPAFLGFYIYNENFDKEPINVHLPIKIQNPYTILSHELSHFFDILNINYSAKIEEAAAKLVGKNFSIQSFLVLSFISNIRNEGFATLNEEFTRSLHPNEAYVGLKLLRLGTDLRAKNISYKESLTKLKQDLKSLMTKNQIDAGKLYQEVLKAQHYEQGRYVCIILLLDMLLRTNKSESVIILNHESYNKLTVLTSRSAKDNKEFQILLNLPAKELLTKFNINSLQLNQIGTYLTEDSVIYIEKPDWNIVYQLIIKISNMNLIEFFNAYEKACNNLAIPKDLRLCAIEEIKKAQEISAKINEKIIKQEGFLP